jgi:hypothetical protein
MPLPRMSLAFLPPSLIRRRRFQWSGFISLVYPFFKQFVENLSEKALNEGMHLTVSLSLRFAQEKEQSVSVRPRILGQRTHIHLNQAA